MKNRLTSAMLVSFLVSGGFVGFVNFESENAQGITYVSGSIAKDTTWNLTGSPYIVTGDVWVEADKTLTIDPGVEVKFDGFYSIYVNGTLIAIGTETDKINMTSNISNPWQGIWYNIQINSNGHAEIKHCNITYASSGIHLSESSYNNITENNISYNLWEGILLSSSSYNNISNNNISNSGNGIRLFSSSYNNITDNIISYIGEGVGDGIYLSSSSNNNITNNNISYNVVGIHLSSSSNNNITNNNISWHDWDGIYLASSLDNTIAGNDISNNRNGIALESSSSNTVVDNDAFSNSNGIDLHFNSNYNTIANNTASNNLDNGIQIMGNSNDNTVIDNIISHNDCGIYLDESSNNTLVNNQMIGDGIDIEGQVVDAWNTHSIDTSNTVSGKPVHYLKNQNGGTIPPGAGEVILANCTNVIIEGQDVSNGSIGILLGFSNNNHIANNTVFSNNMYGIHPSSSKDNTFSNNTASLNDGSGFLFTSSSNNTLTGNKMSYNSVGISFFDSSYNNVTDNNVYSNTNKGISIVSSIGNTIKDNILSNTGYGIYLQSSSGNNIINNYISNNYCGLRLTSSSDENEIIGNTISNNDEYGLRFISSDENDIVGNTIFKTDGYGLHLSDSSRNRIYHNNFIDNDKQAYDNMDDNFWNESYPTGGNYWSDFDEAGEGAFDDFNGSDQNMLGSDGIVDLGLPAGGKNPYIIDVNSQDKYPRINLTKSYLFLYPGWNLISIPLIQNDQDLSMVLKSIKGCYDTVWWYNVSDNIDHWKVNNTSKPPHMNDMNSIDHTMGFWIHITEPYGVLFNYPGIRLIENQTINIHPGWNLVGYPSLGNRIRLEALNNLTFGTEIDSVWTYDAAIQRWDEIGSSDYFEIGKGYWIHSKVEKVWDVPL